MIDRPPGGWRTGLSVPADHGWRARSGFSIIVADGGTARFDVPVGWHMQRGDDCDLHVCDAPPPADECSLKLTMLRMPLPAQDLPTLKDLLRAVAGPGELDVVSCEDPVVEHVGTTALAWQEVTYREQDRQAVARTLLGRGGGLHALFTMSLWAHDRARFEPAWVELRRSLQVGLAYDISGRDPRRN